MKKAVMFVITGIGLLLAASTVSAQTWGDALKSAGQAAGQEAVRVAVQQLTPQAQSMIDASKKLSDGAQQESFLITKAKEFLAVGNYQPALEVANYVITAINSGSVDAKKILADAQAALAKMAENAALATSGAVQAGQADAAAAQ